MIEIRNLPAFWLWKWKTGKNPAILQQENVLNYLLFISKNSRLEDLASGRMTVINYEMNNYGGICFLFLLWSGSHFKIALNETC